MAIVLIVEDEAQVLLLAESYLQEHGHETFSASTVAEASAILERPDKIDVLFTDIGLRDDLQAGLELAKSAVVHRPDLKVLYTTAQTVTDGMRALFVEKSAMLVKPYSVDQLLTSFSMLGVTHPHRDANT
jgi:DNA-binding NtrC family response regulator